MRPIPRLLGLVALLTVVFLLVDHAASLRDVTKLRDITEIGDNAPFGEAALLPWYGAILGVGALAAVYFGAFIVPMIGDAAGRFFFVPDEKVERNPHADALSALAAGDYESAAKEYRAVYDANPEDTHAASEAARLYSEQLGRPGEAADFLVQVLSDAERAPIDYAFLSQRLVDICWFHQRDGARALAILRKIMEEMPETREAANAQHRFMEISRILDAELLYAPETAAAGEDAAGQDPGQPSNSPI